MEADVGRTWAGVKGRPEVGGSLSGTDQRPSGTRARMSNDSEPGDPDGSCQQQVRGGYKLGAHERTVTKQLVV